MTKSIQMYFAPFADSLPSKSDLSLHANGAFPFKRCSKCKTEKPVSNFSKDKRRKNNLRCSCKKCDAEYFIKRFRENPRAYKKRCEERKIWERLNPEKMRNIRSRARKKNLSKPSGLLNMRMGRNIWAALQKNKAGRRWEKLVGYTVNDLRQHIESLFTDGMNWELFMQGKIHIDHKIPKSFFIYEKSEDQEFQYCWSLDNLQPMWAKDNKSKNNKTMDEWEKYKNGNKR